MGQFNFLHAFRFRQKRFMETLTLKLSQGQLRREMKGFLLLSLFSQSSCLVLLFSMWIILPSFLYLRIFVILLSFPSCCLSLSPPLVFIIIPPLIPMMNGETFSCPSEGKVICILPLLILFSFLHHVPFTPLFLFFSTIFSIIRSYSTG